MGITISNKSTTTAPPPKNIQQPRPPGGGGGGGGGGGLKCLLLVPNLRPRFCCCCKIEEMFSSHGRLLTIAIYHHGETLTLIKLTHYDETKNRAHDSQINRAKESLKLSHGGPSYR